MKNLALCVGLLLPAAGLLYVQWAEVRPVPKPNGSHSLPTATHPPAPIQTVAGRSLVGNVTLLNFWRPDCPCTRFNEPHVRSLQERFSPQGLQVITVVSGNKEAEAWRNSGGFGLVSIDGDSLGKAFGVWAAPGAAVVDRRGRVVYVGAYNASRYCSRPETAFAEHAIAAALEGRNPEVTSTPFFGCALNQSNTASSASPKLEGRQVPTRQR